MNQESIVFVILFSGNSVDIRSIVKYFEDVHQGIFNSNFDEISYSIMTNNSLKSKALKYSELNKERLFKENLFNGFSLISLLDNWKYKSMDIKFSVSYSPDFNLKNNSIIVTLNIDLLSEKKQISKFYLDIVKYLKQSGLKPTYGFIFSMANVKFPSLFVEGIGNYSLSIKEEKALEIWAERNNESDFKIWDIFWGNLLTLNHLKQPKFVEILKTLVGIKNFVLVDDSTCFFNLPESNLAFGDEEKSKKNELLKLCNLLGD